MSKKTKKPVKKSVTTETNKISYDVVRIDWKDHNSSNHGWQAPEAILHRPLICVSVGIVVKEDKEGVSLAQNMGHNMDVADTIYILKSCIIFRTKLSTIEYEKN